MRIRKRRRSRVKEKLNVYILSTAHGPLQTMRRKRGGRRLNERQKCSIRTSTTFFFHNYFDWCFAFFLDLNVATKLMLDRREVQLFSSSGSNFSIRDQLTFKASHWVQTYLDVYCGENCITGICTRLFWLITAGTGGNGQHGEKECEYFDTDQKILYSCLSSRWRLSCVLLR